MNLSQITVSGTAMNAFRAKWLDIQKSTPKNWNRTMQAFLKNVKEIRRQPELTTNSIILDGARYFDNSGWLFVTNELVSRLLHVTRTKDTIWMKPNNTQ
jgi:hypothetical protein